MPIEIVADLDEITDEEWHQHRLTGLGGSDAGVVAGLSTWRSAYELWSEKVGGQIPDPSDEKEYQTWGKLLEQPIADEFAKRTGIEVHRFPKMIRSVDHPFMFANVDFITGPAAAPDGVLEVKTTRFADQWEVQSDGSVSVPATYAIQGQHYLAVLNLPVVHYACLIGGQQLAIAEVARNDTLIADLIDIEQTFWDMVQRNEPPPIDGSEGTRKALQRRWTPDPDKVVEVDDLGYLFTLRKAHKEDLDMSKVAIDDIDAQIMAALGDAEVGTVNGKKVVTWKGSTRNSFDQKAFKEAHPALAAEFTKTTAVRTLRFTATKEN